MTWFQDLITSGTDAEFGAWVFGSFAAILAVCMLYEWWRGRK